MAKLNAAARKAIPTSEFAVAGRKYPIEDRAHAANALSRSSGKSVAGTVRAAVKRRYPDMGKPKMSSSLGSK